MDLTRKYLRAKVDNSLFPAGTIAYCIVDLGHEFIVRTSESFHGVQEFIFLDERREDFVLYR